MSKKVLLSPVSETADGLIARNFFAEPVGFGKVSELNELDRRLGNAAVSFEDLADGPGGVALAYDPELIKDEKHVADLVSFCIGHYRNR